jgi:multidrug efflux pump subunit AcrB
MLERAAARCRNCVDANTDLQLNKALLANLVVDRERKAQSLGISDRDAALSALFNGFGVRQIATIYTTSDSYQVIMEFKRGHTSGRTTGSTRSAVRSS